MTQEAAAPAPAVPSELIQALAVLGGAFMPQPNPLGEQEAVKLASSRLSKALPFVLLSWVKSLHDTGALQSIVERETAVLREGGASEEDIPAALLVAFGVLMAKQLQDVLVHEAEKAAAHT